LKNEIWLTLAKTSWMEYWLLHLQSFTEAMHKLNDGKVL